jgi:mono/diheme cytochrome c family protein
MKKLVGGTAIIGLFLYAGAAAAAGPEEIEAGRKIAQGLCASCHAIGMGGASPHPSAPPFRTIVAKGNIERLKGTLSEGMIAGHPDMPQLRFRPRDASALLSYLESLSGRS